MHGCVFTYTGRKWSVSLPYSCDSPPSQWIGDDRQDIGFGIHMISEIPCACWWAWQCLFSSFYTQISLCWFILEQIKTITMCVCMHYYYLKKPSDISCSFSTPASHYSPAHPGKHFSCWGRALCGYWQVLRGCARKEAAAESEALQWCWAGGSQQRHSRETVLLLLAANVLSGGSAVLIRTICFYRLPFVDFRLVFLAMQYKYSQALSFPCPYCLLFIWDHVGAKFKLDW